MLTELTNTKWCKKLGKWWKHWHMGTHLRVLVENCPMNTNMTVFRWFVLGTKVATVLEVLTLMLLVANFIHYKNDAKNLKNDWNPGKWVLIWESSARGFKWIPTWQGSDDFQDILTFCALDKSSLSIGRVKTSPPHNRQNPCSKSANKAMFRMAAFVIVWGHRNNQWGGGGGDVDAEVMSDMHYNS